MNETRDHFLRQGTVGMNFLAMRTLIIDFDEISALFMKIF
eukprot:SAG22_NODE_30_length_28348_cov_12.488584_19_plen_40_part_00